MNTDKTTKYNHSSVFNLNNKQTVSYYFSILFDILSYKIYFATVQSLKIVINKKIACNNSHYLKCAYHLNNYNKNIILKVSTTKVFKKYLSTTLNG